VKRIFILTWIALCGFFLSAVAAPTFGDMAVLVARNYFKNAVDDDASLEQCVAFLNRQGVHFSMFDLLDPDAVVVKEDFARVIGQSHLLFLGEAQLEDGAIKKPNETDSWVDYCLLNDVDLDQFWKGFLRRTEKKPVPEVEKFLNGAGRNRSAE
jgi:hypothetical protein